ncbi:ribosome maturation factor RimP [Actinocorallia sp. API 0066]|uniref:ribosome maturation factor RimP n=1 Tax=Actinocorallia sp. API 0066 TaxID=2896846 RepID=UPI001E3CA701|nr:ribosome maturation factor RimP [Actinocorallia sp. API 0066]MCD0453625.1 ribosome maturation factor RimP [Actinocorallia sp. API 0066]
MSAGARDGRVRGDRQKAALVELLEPVVGASGHDLEDVAVSQAGRRRVVRVVVDADGGVSLDDIAVVSRAVSAALDETDVLGGSPYVLEVTSPGVDRPLTEPRHWRRAAGRLVRAPLTTAEGGAPVEGRVLGADDREVRIEVAGQERAFALADLGPGRVQVEFRRIETQDDDQDDQDDSLREDLLHEDEEGGDGEPHGH